MRIEKRNWSITLGGANRGADLEREANLRRFQGKFEEILDAFVTGDNQTVAIPVTYHGEPLDAFHLDLPDLDPALGRVMTDFAQGTLRKGEDPTPHQEYALQLRARGVLEFAPASGKNIRFSLANQECSYDASFQDGELKEFRTESRDGSYREALILSDHGRTATFSSVEQVKPGAEPDKKGEWFLTLR